MAADGHGDRAHTLRAWNDTRQTPLVEGGRLARSLWSRARGLLGTRSLASGDGLLLCPCSSIHSFFMRYAFDALFLDRSGRIVHIIDSMAPNRVSRPVFSARCVLELPAGTIRATSTRLGDRIRWTLGNEEDGRKVLAPAPPT